MVRDTCRSSAAQSGRTDDIHTLSVEHGAAVECPDKCWDTPRLFTTIENLHFACRHGLTEAVRLLIAKGANLEQRNSADLTPLQIAVFRGHLDIVQMLVTEGADVECTDKNGSTLLLWACEIGQNEAAKILLEGRAVVNYSNGSSPLQQAAQSGYLDFCRLLLSHGADPDCKNVKGDTVLLWASQLGHTDLVDVFLEGGADIEFRNNSGTPLQWACVNHHLETVSLLLKKGADIEQKDCSTETLLHWATSSSNMAIVCIFLEHGANVECKDIIGCSPLTTACRQGEIEIARQLLLKNANTETKDIYEQSALHWTAQCNSPKKLEIIQLLCQSGAVVDSIDSDGNTPLFLACQTGSVDVAQLLVQRGANIQHQNWVNENLLYVASSNGHLDMVRYLISLGAPFDDKHRLGKMPIDIAQEKGHQEVANELLAYMQVKETRTAEKAAVDRLAAEKEPNRVQLSLMHMQEQRKSVTDTANVDLLTAEKAKKQARMFHLISERVQELQSSSLSPKPSPSSLTTMSPIEATIVHQLAQAVVERQAQLKKAELPAPVAPTNTTPALSSQPIADDSRPKLSDWYTCLQCVLCLVFCIFPTG